MPPTTFVDQAGATPGTSLNASSLNGISVADLTEAATNDTLGGSSTFWNNLSRIRYILAQIQSGAWNAATAMIPLTQKAAASGVASLDAGTHVVQKPVKGIRDYQASFISTDTDINSVASTLTAVPGLGTLTLTADSGSKITFSVTGTMHNSTGGSPQFRFAVRLDATATYVYMGMWSCAAALNRVNYCCKAIYTPADTSAHTYTLYYDNNGASWANGLTGVNAATQPQNDSLIFEAIEHN